MNMGTELRFLNGCNMYVAVMQENSSSAWVVLIPSTFTCKMLMESDTTRQGRCEGDGGEEEEELEGKEGDVGGEGFGGVWRVGVGRRVLRMGNLRDGGGVGRRGGLGEGRGGRGGFFMGMGDVECEAVVVVSTCPAEDVGPV